MRKERDKANERPPFPERSVLRTGGITPGRAVRFGGCDFPGLRAGP